MAGACTSSPRLAKRYARLACTAIHDRSGDVLRNQLGAGSGSAVVTAGCQCHAEGRRARVVSGAVPHRMKSFLLVGGIALSLVLLVGAGLMVRGVDALYGAAAARVDPLISLRCE